MVTTAATTLDQLRSHQLIGTQRLDLAAGLTTFPEEILDLADSLEILDLSNNAVVPMTKSAARAVIVSPAECVRPEAGRRR